MKYLILSIYFTFSIVLSGNLLAETIRGKACYRFSDSESITAARDIALSMAKREALESYAVFVKATTNIENFTVKNDLITSISASILKNMVVVSKSENFGKREICREIRAEVEGINVREDSVFYNVCKDVYLPPKPNQIEKHYHSFSIPEKK